MFKNLFIGLFVVVALSACGKKSEAPKRLAGWDQATFDNKVLGCVNAGAPVTNINTYCKCLFDKFAATYDFATFSSGTPAVANSSLQFKNECKN